MLFTKKAHKVKRNGLEVLYFGHNDYGWYLTMNPQNEIIKKILWQHLGFKQAYDGDFKLWCGYNQENIENELEYVYSVLDELVDVSVEEIIV